MCKTTSTQKIYCLSGTNLKYSNSNYVDYKEQNEITAYIRALVYHFKLYTVTFQIN